MAGSMLPAEELSRAISEINLTTLASRTGLQYTQDELLNLRPGPERENGENRHSPVEGLKTPPSVLAPPPTPEHLPDTPAETEIDTDSSHTLHSASAGSRSPTSAEPQSQANIPKAALTVADPNTPKIPAEVARKVHPVDDGKPKKKGEGSGKKRVPAPTGFEDWYADPPITPAEHDEESEIYGPDHSFAERIEKCIQRYRGRRKLDGQRANILTKFLMLGGVDAGVQKAFSGGLDRETVENSTAQEIAAIQAIDHIRTGQKNAKYYDPAHPEHWVVDFVAVVKGFLAPKMIGAESVEEIERTSAVITNFLNYLLTHSVCPEYTEDILEARRICGQAVTELKAILAATRHIPGDFNLAASILYGGHYSGIYPPDGRWVVERSDQDDNRARNGLNNLEAERIFKTAIAFAGDSELFVEAMRSHIDVVRAETRYFEVVRIDRPNVKTKEEYSKVKDHLGRAGNIKALGVVHVRHWEGPGLESEDMTDDESKEAEERDRPLLEKFWLEDMILQHFFIGMKLEAVVRELNIGVKYFDKFQGLYCSFYTALPNEKMAYWKEPVPNERPAPTEDDPDMDEKAQNAIIEGEVADDEKIFGEKKAKKPAGEA
ncbi:hypothetical protein B7494_g6555 [Chlorociboria aeruginascens]|nr:hypothetical protein B7494_g6555 [Chlorociboria aeruginascens]